MSIITKLFWKSEDKPGHSKKVIPVEKRATKRFRDGQVTYFFPLIGQSLEMKILDISTGGVRISANHDISKNARGELLLTLKDTMLRLPLKISWKRELTKKCYEYGAQFTLGASGYRNLIQKYINIAIQRNLSLKEASA